MYLWSIKITTSCVPTLIAKVLSRKHHRGRKPLHGAPYSLQLTTVILDTTAMVSTVVVK